jgi:pilus assembly protein Flp/PilA
MAFAELLRGRSIGGARQRGASLVEYALLVALIAVVCVVAVTYFGGATSTSFSDSGNSLAAS